jgi:dolichol-phosphate mannosyltransferase
MLSAVVPCYNEEATLAELHRRLGDACRAAVGDAYEIVLVDDGSRDRTWAQMAGLAARDRHIVAVRLTRNHGHQLALSAGLEIARGERILIVDADLQDPPELLADMMRLMDAGADVVYGQRTDRRGETAVKRLTAALFYRLLQRLSEVEIPLDSGDFRLMSRKTLDLLRQMPEQHRFVRGMVAWIGLEKVPIPYVREARFAGETKYPVRKMVRLGLDAVTGFSTKPLRIASYLGFVFAVMSVIGIGYTLWSSIFLDTVSGWASVMTVVLILGAVQLLVLGVIGEYLGRMYIEVKRRPLFLIDRILRGETEAEPRLAQQLTQGASETLSRPAAGAAPRAETMREPGE